MNSAKKIHFLPIILTELLHENIFICAFWREDEWNQQLLRLYKIERILIFGRIQIGTIYLGKGNGFDYAFRIVLHWS